MWHPDFFVNSPDEHEKMLELTALNNKAYEILADFNTRLAYVLGLEEMLSESSKLNPMFLMEMMEWNERIDDLAFEESEEKKGKIDALSAEFKDLESSMRLQLEQHCADWDNNKNMSDLEKVKDFHLKLKYLLRIKEAIDKFADH
jgi:molecular chaperone HscB